MNLSLCDTYMLFVIIWLLISTKKDDIVEAEIQLVMWYCKEGGRGRWELLHRIRQLPESEVQGRKKNKSSEEMERKQDEMWVLLHWLKETTSLCPRWLSSTEHLITPHYIKAFRNPLVARGFVSVVASGFASRLWTKHFLFGDEG